MSDDVGEWLRDDPREPLSAVAECIVRALAETNTWHVTEHGGWLACALCGVERPEGHGADSEHERDCLWRMAVEWAALRGTEADDA